MVSISILTTLVNLGIENVKIKWPNDILIGDEKQLIIKTKIKTKNVRKNIAFNIFCGFVHRNDILK